MTDSLARRWYDAFLDVVRRHEASSELREAAIAEKLDAWTGALTRAVVASCAPMGWIAAAKGRRCAALPVAREEYLSLDVVALPAESASRWRFPAAVFELENDRGTDRVAYSLWKVMSVRADLRVVFCYRRDPEQGPGLVADLRDQVLGAIPGPERARLGGETALVVGSRDDAERFPYGFFRWWELETNTGAFRRA